jgi:hypothetical protein
VSVLRKLGKTRTDGSNLQGAGAGSAASWPFFFSRNKTVLSATAVACDHRRSRRNSICRGVSRSLGLRQKRKSKGDDRGRGPRVMRDKKSICMYICLHVTPTIVEVRRRVQPELRPPN